jgi:hypothetical protein
VNQPTAEQLAALRVRIAEMCGWHSVSAEYRCGLPPDVSLPSTKDILAGNVNMWPLPDYTGSLDAAYEMEETLKPQRVKNDGTYNQESKEWGRYFMELCRVCEEWNLPIGHCPAWARCVAFDRTLSSREARII